MTRDEILNMPAGREMDALVWMALHEQNPDLTLCRFVDGEYQPNAGYPSGHISPPNYSTDIAAAWDVVKKICIEAPEDCWTGPQMQINYSYEECEVIFTNLDSIDCISETAEATAKNLPLAICRAALIAVMEAQ